MPRIAGVDIPGEKRIVISLTYIYGISKHLSQKALKALGMDENVRAKDVSEDDMSTLGVYLDKNFVIEGNLRRQESQNIARLKNIGCHRGLRDSLWVAARGQRTKTNARAREGERRTVSVKKGIKEMR